ncbi:helix-turn-helix domain-containing protein [Phytoactinopolyspora halophila]|uniref:helix-turn-helix domain-containing protein n=1 Tax=Phytoactinopolyspora halophila TaxID=1981511 RepID=UPI001314C81E|nr:helix-turn-helix domain-containing protein [Phytoactinopolyspora halophila]
MAQYLTADQMTAVLHVHPSTVRRWAEGEKIPAVKLPGNEDGNGRTRWRSTRTASSPACLPM